MRWIKARERLPDTVECEIVFRTIDKIKFVIEIHWDTKIVPDDEYYEWLDETEALIPTDIEQEAKKRFPEKETDSLTNPAIHQHNAYQKAQQYAFVSGYQLISKKLEEKEQEIQRLQEKLNEANKLIKSLDYGL